MRIKGVVEVEGVRLHVDIQAPDEREDVYVTNLHPNCLVVPKERWYVEFLGLSQSAQVELAAENIRHLGQLTDGEWKLSRNGLTEATTSELNAALQHLREMALLFEQTPLEQIVRELVGFPIPEVAEEDAEAGETGTAASEAGGALPLDTPLKEVPKLAPVILDLLPFVHKARTIADVLKLGTGRIIMTPGITAKDVTRLVEVLAEAGHKLTKEPQEAGHAQAQAE
ncbi:MAG: hypothetical protein HYW81_00700 [Parcubacteria group bacterium]|nr:hypothetical protein [Parcubacteria group bacterium]